MTWASLSREVGVSASTIRRVSSATDAEADGVLLVVRWLGVSPESFIVGQPHSGELLPHGGVVRVDMDKLRQTVAGGSINPNRTRTTIQGLTEAAVQQGVPIALLTRISEV